MHTTFHIKADDLDENFLKAVKKLFKRKAIAITVEEEMDETKYLLSSAANRRMLRKSLAEAKAGKLIRVDIDKKE